ncbi:MAG: EscU/YscU/HrcU family type III secretion system export apparatus switch protein, partial [Spirochaetales bacterium]|nr:EscU/YscU/HrcU family type III secretion system export apparatus switch protein [Spirochaetales bacterium]
MLRSDGTLVLSAECFDWRMLLDLPTDITFDLQRFSAESEGRTEEATEHQKRKAREEGQVGLSKDLPSALVTLFGFITVYAMGRYFFETLTELLTNTLTNCSHFALNDVSIYKDLMITPALKLFIPVAIVTVIVSLISNYGQIGFKFTPKSIKPNLKKLIPDVIKFFKERVFSPQAAFNLMKSIVKIIIIGAMAFLTVKGCWDQIMALSQEDSSLNAFLFICKMLFDLILRTSIIMALFSIVDVFFTRKQQREKLKMTKQQVKQEWKDIEGDPEVKARLNQMYQQLMTQSKQLNNVKDADVVVTNPTHFAVALKRDTRIADAPIVVAKGEDTFAQKIKQVARENNIFTYENVPLARKLYSDVKINEIVPEELFVFVVTAYQLAEKYNQE